MQEIGGYLGFETLYGNEFYEDALAFNTARGALLWLVKQRKISRIFLPAYLCLSVQIALQKGHSCEISFYEVDEKFLPVGPILLGEREYLYVVNYYGQLCNDRLVDLWKKYRRIIVDNVQAFFQAPLGGIDTIYSCRKWFGVPDGSYLCTELAIDDNALDQDVSGDRLEPLVGCFEYSAERFYPLHKQVEASLDQEKPKKMSEFTHNILRGLDYARICKRRNSNFEYLHHHLKQTNSLSLRVPEGAFYYPYLVSHATEMRQKLIDNKIFVPVLWPGVPDQRAEKILPLPLDQRYMEKEMQIIINTVQGG